MLGGWWYGEGVETQARIEAAKLRLGTQRAILSGAKEAGPPCVKCEHFVVDLTRPEGPFCGHPVYTDHAFNPARGKLAVKLATNVEDARGPQGLCGPEALLFDPMPLDARIKSALAIGFLASVAVIVIFG